MHVGDDDDAHRVLHGKPKRSSDEGPENYQTRPPELQPIRRVGIGIIYEIIKGTGLEYHQSTCSRRFDSGSETAGCWHLWSPLAAGPALEGVLDQEIGCRLYFEEQISRLDDDDGQPCDPLRNLRRRVRWAAMAWSKGMSSPARASCLARPEANNGAFARQMAHAPAAIHRQMHPSQSSARHMPLTGAAIRHKAC